MRFERINLIMNQLVGLKKVLASLISLVIKEVALAEVIFWKHQIIYGKRKVEKVRRTNIII